MSAGHAKPRPMRDVFFEGLYERAKDDPSIILLSNDQGAPSLDRFRRDLPAQFVNMAIAEQNIISVAAGLARSGKNVFVYGIAPFVTSRCFEQIKIDICVMGLPVTIIGVGAGYSYAPDGPTHHATEDIAVMRSLAGMRVYSPADWRMVDPLVDVTLRCSGPVYLRLDRQAIAVETATLPDRTLCGATVLRRGRDVCLVATGVMVPRAIEVARALAAKGIVAGVVDLYQLKPVAAELCLELTRYPRVVTLDEHTLYGGVGTVLAEVMADLPLNIPLRRIGPDEGELYVHAPREQLHWELGLDAAALAEQITGWVQGDDKTVLATLRKQLAKRATQQRAAEDQRRTGARPVAVPEPLGLPC